MSFTLMRDCIKVFGSSSTLKPYVDNMLVDSDKELLIAMKFLLKYSDHNEMFVEFAEITGTVYDIDVIVTTLFTEYDWVQLCMLESMFLINVISSEIQDSTNITVLQLLTTSVLRALFSIRYATDRNELPRSMLLRILSSSCIPCDSMFLKKSQEKPLEFGI